MGRGVFWIDFLTKGADLIYCSCYLAVRICVARRETKVTIGCLDGFGKKKPVLWKIGVKKSEFDT